MHDFYHAAFGYPVLGLGVHKVLYFKGSKVQSIALVPRLRGLKVDFPKRNSDSEYRGDIHVVLYLGMFGP